MRDPLSRKLFTTRDAREHLRGMGGIMSSSPRLAETVAKFNDGGGVIAPVIPTVASVSGIPETADILAQAEAMFGPARLQWPDDAISQAMQVLMAQGSTGAPAPTAPTGLSSDVLAELDVLGVSPEEFSRLTAEEQQNILTPDITQTMRDRFAETTPPYEAPGPSNLETFVAETLFPGRAAEMRRRDAAAGLEPPAVAEQRQAVAESRAAAAARTETEAEAGDAEARAVDQTAAEQEATEQAAAAERERQEAARRAQEELERNRGTGDTGGDLDTTFDQMLGRLERVMGTKDEDSRQKAMANLAMIGLAIAAGQSPDALTNIAQGALTGMQGIRQAQAAEEAQEQEMRLAALKMAQEEVNLGRRLQSAEQIAAMRAGGDAESQRQEYLYNDVFRGILEQARQETEDDMVAVNRAAAAAAAAAPNAPSAIRWRMSQGQGAEGFGTTVPTVTTQAEYDALPPGAEFIQSGQRRRKPE